MLQIALFNVRFVTNLSYLYVDFYLVLSTPITGLWLGCSVIAKPFVRDFPFSQPLSGSLKCDVKGAEFYPHTNCEYTFDENRHNTSFVNFKGSKVKKKTHTEQTLLLFLYQREEIASVYFQCLMGFLEIIQNSRPP